MKIWKITTLLLAIALVGTNCWWLYNAIDAGVTNKYQDQMIYEQTGMLKQLIAVTPELSSDKDKTEIVAIVQKSSDLDPFEKEGAVWIGWLGLQFSDKGKLIKVIPPWDSIE
jgi:hypothetical protein